MAFVSDLVLERDALLPLIIFINLIQSINQCGGGVGPRPWEGCTPSPHPLHQPITINQSMRRLSRTSSLRGMRSFPSSSSSTFYNQSINVAFGSDLVLEGDALLPPILFINLISNQSINKCGVASLTRMVHPSKIWTQALISGNIPHWNLWNLSSLIQCVAAIPGCIGSLKYVQGK